MTYFEHISSCHILWLSHMHDVLLPTLFDGKLIEFVIGNKSGAHQPCGGMSYAHPCSEGTNQVSQRLSFVIGHGGKDVGEWHWHLHPRVCTSELQHNNYSNRQTSTNSSAKIN